MGVQEVITLRNRIIGVLVRAARLKAGRTKRECAEVLGVSPSTYTAFEEGRKPLSLPELEVLAYHLDVPLQRLLEDNVEEEEPEEIEDILELRHRIVGAMLRQAREEARMTQRELAELVGRSPGRISAYEYGKRPIPVAELEIMAEALGQPLETFMDTEGPLGIHLRDAAEFEAFRKMPDEMREFVLKPINVSYLEVAMRLAEMPAGALRSIAEGILDITF